jgi:2-aminoethylphosphonate-pyruvate transaminase
MSTDKLLFTPGPLTTGATLKAAMLCDAGSRDIRQRLLRIGGAPPGGDYECVPMQGSGTLL